MASVRRYSHLQQVPIGPPHDMAEFIRKADGNSRRMYLRKGRKCGTGRGRGGKKKKKGEKKQREHQGQRRKRRKRKRGFTPVFIFSLPFPVPLRGREM